jgi:hypothetical protein
MGVRELWRRLFRGFLTRIPLIQSGVVPATHLASLFFVRTVARRFVSADRTVGPARWTLLLNIQAQRFDIPMLPGLPVAGVSGRAAASNRTKALTSPNRRRKASAPPWRGGRERRWVVAW